MLSMDQAGAMSAPVLFCSESPEALGRLWVSLASAGVKTVLPFPTVTLGEFLNQYGLCLQYHCDGKPGVMHYKRHVHLPDKGCLP